MHLPGHILWIAALALLLALPPALSEIDDAEYQQALDEIAAKQDELDNAITAGEFSRLYSLRKEIDEMKQELRSGRLGAIFIITQTWEDIQEIEQLLVQASTAFNTDTTELNEKLSLLEQELNEAESSFYESEYDSAILIGYKTRKDLSGILSDTMVLSLSEISSIEEKLENRIIFSPGPARLISDAKKQLQLAKQHYLQGQQFLENNETDSANQAFDESREAAKRAFELVVEAEAGTGPLESIIIAALILLPLGAVAVLIFYFYKHLKRTQIISNIDKKRVKENTLTEVERTITVRNMEKKQILALIIDSLDPPMRVSTIYTEPERESKERLIWRAEIAPGEEKTFSYSLVVPPTPKGTSLTVTGAKVMYALDGHNMAFASEDEEIKVE